MVTGTLYRRDGDAGAKMQVCSFSWREGNRPEEGGREKSLFFIWTVYMGKNTFCNKFYIEWFYNVYGLP